MATIGPTGHENLVFPDHMSPVSNSPSHTLLPTSRTQSQAVEAAMDIVFGSTAGILGKFVEYPFDTVKVRLQAQSTSSSAGLGHIHGPLDAFAAAWRSPEGPFRNLYRGLSAPLIGAAVETSSLFFSYRIAQDILVATSATSRRLEDMSDNAKAHLPFSALLAAGAASGAFTSVLLTPIELIKCKMQVALQSPNRAPGFGPAPTKRPGPLQLIRLVFKSHGLLGFWHGQLGTLIRETGGSAAWFGSYEGVKILFENYNMANPRSTVEQMVEKQARSRCTTSVSQQLLAGAAAGVSYNFFFYPADTIKSRMQTEEAAVAGSRQTSFLRTGTQLWKQQGLKGFYRGCGTTVFRAAPSSAIIFGIYEALRTAFG